MADAAQPVTFVFDGTRPYFAMILEFEREPIVAGTFDDDSAFALGRWLADKPEWYELLQQALELYRQQREGET